MVWLITRTLVSLSVLVDKLHLFQLFARSFSLGVLIEAHCNCCNDRLRPSSSSACSSSSCYYSYSLNVYILVFSHKECPDLRYGVNCNYECHCPIGDSCAAINGLCSSGRCGEGYYGPGCQISELYIALHSVDTMPVCIFMLSPSTMCHCNIDWEQNSEV